MNTPVTIRNNTEMTFGGRWEHRRLLPRRYGICNNTASVSCEAGAYAACAFERCDRLQWYTSLNHPGSMGKAEVYLDGVPVAVVDTSGFPENTTTLAYDSGPLLRGKHTLCLVTCDDGKGSIEVDHIKAYGEPAPTREIDGRNLAFVHYTCGFSERETGGVTLSVSHEAGDECEVYFLGRTLRIYGARGADFGKCEIIIDGEPICVVDARADAEVPDELLFETDGLDDTTHFHCLTVRVMGEGDVGLSRFVVDERPCLLTVMNDLTTRALARMTADPTYTPPSQWHPVTPVGRIPEDGVVLGAGVWKTAFDRNIRYLLDCLSKPRWIDDPPHAFSIWVDFLVASNEGRMLGGMGHTLRWQEVPEFREAIADMLNTVRRRRDANDGGYLMPYDSRNYKSWEHRPWPETSKGEQKNYDRAMFTKGMLAVGRAGFEEAYTLLRGFYDWFNAAEEYLPGLLTDSMGIQGSIAGPMVYHSPIGRPEDIITNMKYYDLDWWMDYLDAGVPEAIYRFTLNRPHNYLLTSICAYFEQYLATGEDKYIKACRGAYRVFRKYFQNVGSAITVCEHFECPPHTHLISNRPNSIQETCGNVFWIDLCHRLLSLEPACEEYAAEIEASLYTILFACQAEDGRIRYFNHMDAEKFPPLRANTCCEIQATMQLGSLPQYIYMTAEDGAYIHQYAESELAFEVEGRPYRLAMATRFPYEDGVAVTVSTPAGGRMKLRVRIPRWTAETVLVMVNGVPTAEGASGSYVILDRVWQDGDTVSFRIPMYMSATRYTGLNRVSGYDRYGFMYGPMLMAVQGPLNQSCTPSAGGVSVAETPNPEMAEQNGDELTIRFGMRAAEFLARLEPAGELCFAVRGEADYTLVPYWSVDNGVTYSCFAVFNREKGERHE